MADLNRIICTSLCTLIQNIFYVMYIRSYAHLALIRQSDNPNFLRFQKVNVLEITLKYNSFFKTHNRFEDILTRAFESVLERKRDVYSRNMIFRMKDPGSFYWDSSEVGVLSSLRVQCLYVCTNFRRMHQRGCHTKSWKKATLTAELLVTATMFSLVLSTNIK